MIIKIFPGVVILAVTVFVSCLVGAQQPLVTESAEMTQALAPEQANCTLSTTKPSPATQNYNVSSCIVAKLAAYIKIGESQYVNLQNGKDKMVNGSVCESNVTDPKLVIEFDCGQLEFEITRNNSEIYIRSLNGYYKNGAKEETFASAGKLFVTNEVGHYYKCNSEQPIAVRPGLNAPNSTLSVVVSNFAYEAYRTTGGTDFYKIAEECALDTSPFSDGVRIGVGVCLVAFVAIILIAYFVGRRRWSQRSSYESV